METDYSKIAKIYDNNPVRKKNVDPEIGRLLKEKQRLTVLDLACIKAFFDGPFFYYTAGCPVKIYARASCHGNTVIPFVTCF